MGIRKHIGKEKMDKKRKREERGGIGKKRERSREKEGIKRGEE